MIPMETIVNIFLGLTGGLLIGFILGHWATRRDNPWQNII